MTAAVISATNGGFYMKQNKKLIISSIVAALSLFLMIIAGIIPIGTYAIPVIASLLYIILIREVGYGWAIMAYTVTSIMSLILCADKETAINFILFFGYYPILKMLLEKIKPLIIKIIIKLIIFNIAMIAVFYIAKFLLMIPESSYTIFGLYIPGIILAVGNVVFIIYDYALTGLTAQYDNYWSRIIRKIIK